MVIKADIEGAELKIIPDMVVTGAFGHVDNLHMEWHGNASYRSAPATWWKMKMKYSKEN